MYSVEYTCTKVETKVTTINIITVKLSIQKNQSTCSQFIEIQCPKLILKTYLPLKILKNKIKELINAQKILLVVIKQTPKPKRKPKKQPLKKPNNGDNKIKASIINNKKFGF